MSKINLLYIINSLTLGGAEKQVVTLLNHLDKERYHVVVCCIRSGGPLEDEIRDENVEVIYLRMRLRYFFIAIYKLVRLMKKKNIQIVHTHLYTSSFWGRIAAWIAGVPIVIATEHGRGLWKKGRHLMFERIANRYTDMRIAVSEDVRQIRINREHTHPEKVMTIRNAINPDDFMVSDSVRQGKRKELGIKDDELIVGTVARLDPDKGLHYLLEAAAHVAEAINDARFILVGDGELKQYLENYALKLGIADKVIFTGSRTDIAEFLSIMDVFVNSSIREGIPVSLLEAMAAEKPVVATKVGGIPEVINDESVGILVPSENVMELTGAIIALLNNKALRVRMGLKARERIQSHFSANMQARQIMGIYEDLLMKNSI